LISGLEKLDVVINSNLHCLPHMVNVSLKNIKSEVMLHALEEEDIYISTQTACSTGNYSKAVYAITHDKDLASSSIRISLSHLTTEEEIDTFLKVFEEKLESLSFRR
jgi:cysteine desulfurase